MAFSLKDTFGTVKPVIAMVHFPGLPGRPQHDRAAGRARLLDVVARDLAALQDAGVAMLAGIGAGVYSGPGEAVAAACHPAEPLLPDPGRAGVYDAAYRRYRAVIASGLARAGPVCQHAASGDEEGLP